MEREKAYMLNDDPPTYDEALKDKARKEEIKRRLEEEEAKKKTNNDTETVPHNKSEDSTNLDTEEDSTVSKDESIYSDILNFNVGFTVENEVEVNLDDLNTLKKTTKVKFHKKTFLDSDQSIIIEEEYGPPYIPITIPVAKHEVLKINFPFRIPNIKNKRIMIVFYILLLILVTFLVLMTYNNAKVGIGIAV